MPAAQCGGNGSDGASIRIFKPPPCRSLFVAGSALNGKARVERAQVPAHLGTCPADLDLPLRGIPRNPLTPPPRMESLATGCREVESKRHDHPPSCGSNGR